MKSRYLLYLLVVFFSCQSKIDTMEYPITKKELIIDSYFGTKVNDNFRWLEDDRSQETREWVGQQNDYTQSYLNKGSLKKPIRNRLEKVLNHERLSPPFRRGNFIYFYKNDGLQNQYVVYKKYRGITEVFLDPNSFSKDGSVSLGALSFSPDGSLTAYEVSYGGSDWMEIIVINSNTKEIIGDTLFNIKFSNGVSWRGNDGFFYSTYDKPSGSMLSAKTDHHKLYYHKLGTPQKDDELIFGSSDKKFRYVSHDVSEDGFFLLIYGAEHTSGNKLFIRDLRDVSSRTLTIIDDFSSNTSLLHNEGEQLYFQTNRNAPNNKVILVSFDDLYEEYWTDIIAENENVLDPTFGGGYFFGNYMIDAVSRVYQFDLQGNQIGEILLPGIGSSNGFSAKKSDKEIYYTFSNYHTPTSIFRFDLESRQSEIYWTPKIDFNSSNYISRQSFYSSKDGTKIPIIITHKKGLEYDKKNPTILYAYGGFNISLQPYFDPIAAVWMENDGVYAVANIRGGGEYGKEWHLAGTKMNKQNVFDDFICAAEYLCDKAITSSEYLAIKGGSNGGLLVGAMITQKPELFKVAIPIVGVLDMLRYHKFTSGAGWASDYGTSEDSKEMFDYIKQYSPVHNVKKGISYPATMVVTGDHDDRVVPAHSYKFIAELQDKQMTESPVIIRISTKAGHGAGTSTSEVINRETDIMAFILYNMGASFSSN